MRSVVRCVAIATLAAATVARAADFVVVPAVPSAGWDFTLSLTSFSGCGPAGPAHSVVSGNTITFAYEETEACFPEPPPGAPIVSVTVRVPSAGLYDVREHADYHGKVITDRSRGTLIVAAAPAGTGTLSVYPPQPRAGQDFVVHYQDTACTGGMTPGKSTVLGTTIRLAYTSGWCGLAPPPALRVATTVRVAAAGAYAVQDSNGNAVGVVEVLPAASVTRTTTSLAGLWYVPEQPGWGLDIAEGESGQLFLTWFVYYGNYGYAATQGVVGGSWYYVSGGQWTSTNRFEGVLNQPYGPALRQPFDPAKVVSIPIGTASVTLTSANALTFTVQANDGSPLEQVYSLARYRF